MEITYPEVITDVARLSIDGKPIEFKIPPATGTHEQIFQALSNDKQINVARGREIAAYAHGCLVYQQNEWSDQNKLRFPTKN